MGIGYLYKIWFRIFGAANVGTIFVGLIPKDLNTALTVGQEWTVIQMINIIGAFVTLIGAFIFGWMGNLPMTIAMLAGVIYFKE